MWMLYFAIILAMWHGSAGDCNISIPSYIDLPDIVDPKIQAERDRLQAKPNHFVGKVDMYGTQKHCATRDNKPRRVPNPRLQVWNNTVKVLPGGMPSDPPEKANPPSNIDEASKYGKGCLKPGKQFPPIPSGYLVSTGPQKENITIDDYEPCSDRIRGLKSKYRRLGTMGNRKKRSESYSYPSMLWKKPTIPFIFHSSVPSSVKDKIGDAIAKLQESTCLSFVYDRSEGTKDYPHIVFMLKTTGACSTDRLGPNNYPPYTTNVDVSRCGQSIGSIVHEICHALGLSHSQKRVDRDESLKIIFENIAQSWAPQFAIDSGKYFDDWGVPFYYDSIMQYFPYAATRNGLMTICPLDPLMEVIMGQRENLAFGDISLINNIYCRESCFDRQQLKGMKFEGSLSRTISGRVCQKWSAQSPHKHKFPSVGNHNNCRNPDGWEGGPWCFTTDPTVRYEPCFSPCQTLEANRATRPYCKNWCYNGGYHHPTNCNCKCPPHTTGEFCETINTTLKYPHVRCGGKISLNKIGDKTSIKSPNYPADYSPSTVCTWWIQSPNGTEIKLSMSDFSLEIPDVTGCYDYLEIRPSLCAAAIERPEKMRFCGNSLAPNSGNSPRQLHSDDNNMVLKFYSDDSMNGKGFSVTAEVVKAT